MTRAAFFALLVAFAAIVLCQADITDDIKGKVGEMKKQTKRSVDAPEHTMEKREGLKQPVKRQMVAAPVDAYGNPVMVQQPQYAPPQQQVIVQEAPKQEEGGFFNYAYKAFFGGGR